MWVRIFLLSFILFVICCGSKEQDVISSQEKLYLENWAGRLAVIWLLGPLDESRLDESLDSLNTSREELEILLERCEENPDFFVYLYKCASDSILNIEPPPPSCHPYES